MQGPGPDGEAPAAPFVPTVTAISTSPDLQWMVQPTIITSVSPSATRPETGETAAKRSGAKAKNSARKGKVEQVLTAKNPNADCYFVACFLLLSWT